MSSGQSPAVPSAASPTSASLPSSSAVSPSSAVALASAASEWQHQHDAVSMQLDQLHAQINHLMALKSRGFTDAALALQVQHALLTLEGREFSVLGRNLADDLQSRKISQQDYDHHAMLLNALQRKRDHFGHLYSQISSVNPHGREREPLLSKATIETEPASTRAHMKMWRSKVKTQSSDSSIQQRTMQGYQADFITENNVATLHSTTVRQKELTVKVSDDAGDNDHRFPSSMPRESESETLSQPSSNRMSTVTVFEKSRMGNVSPRPIWKWTLIRGLALLFAIGICLAMLGLLLRIKNQL